MPIVRPFGSLHPHFGPRVWLADNATVVGDVHLGEDTNIWFGAVLRGDVGKVRIGARVNVQDLSCVHMTKYISEAILDDDVSIGHSVVVHGAVIEAGALIGMGSIIMDNARIGEGATIGAGSLVTSGTVIPPRSLALGRPAKVVRTLSDDEAYAGRKTATRYIGLAKVYAEGEANDGEPV